MESRETTNQRLLEARMFILQNGKPGNGFHFHSIHQYPPLPDGSYVFNGRFHKDATDDNKCDKTFIAFSYCKGKFSRGFNHLPYLKNGGNLLPYNGISLENPCPEKIVAGNIVFIVNFD